MVITVSPGIRKQQAEFCKAVSSLFNSAGTVPALIESRNGWPDANGDRSPGSLNYRTHNGTSMYARPDIASIIGPAGKPTELTAYDYDAGGFLDKTVDPLGSSNVYTNDFLGRVTRDQVYGSGDTASSQQTSYSYDGLDRQVTVDVKNVTPSGESFSLTVYTYQARTADGSAINSNDLLSEIQYPGPTTQLFRYDALGQLIFQTNRDKSAHGYMYDPLGRQVLDLVVKFADSVDQTVVALGSTYDALGRLVYATSYGSGGNIINEVGRVYDGLGNLVTEYQSHSGAINASSTPKVQYQYTTTYETASTWGA